MTTDAEHYARLQAIFEEVRGLQGSARAEALEQRCGSDDALRQEVEGLLRSLESTGADALSEQGIAAARDAFREVVGDDASSSPSGATWLPERIGAYAIERRIGEGGMGVVYEALQESPRRKVAIKLLHPQLASPERLRRFRHEAELLGRLQHPGIAQIHEAGTYDLGRGEQPFFAMELVDGVNIRLYAERERLDVRGRLALLAQVADAVHHAHERGVVHRDLKPDNLLVDERGQPKVLDFGVARASEGSDVVSTLLTQEGVLLGTLAYMAPEQLTGDSTAVTPRTDVYALGVIAFELLSGRLPHEIGGLQLPAAMKVLENEPTKSLSALDSALRGDVETIVTTALEREPARRFESAEAFASDVRRFLDDLPIAARPASRIYRLRKYARRNRSLVTVLAIAILAAVVSTLFGLRAQRESRESQRKAAQMSLMAASQESERGEAARELLASVPPEYRGWEWRHLNSRQERPLAKLDAYYRVVALDDGRLLSPAQHSDVVWIDTDSGATLERVHVAPDLWYAMQRPSRRELLVFGGERGGLAPARPMWVGIWNLDLREFTSRHEFRSIGNCHFGPRGTRVFASDLERVFSVDPETGVVLAAADIPGIVGMTQTGDALLAASYPSTRGPSWLLDAQSLEVIQRLPFIRGGRLSPDGTRAATSDDEGALDLWDLTATPPSRRRLWDGAGGMAAGFFAPDGIHLVSTHSVDNRLRLWNLESGELLRVLSGHGAGTHRVVFLPDSRRFVSIDLSGEIRSWSLDSDPFVLEGHTSYVYPVSFWAQRGLIVSGGWDGYEGSPGSLRFWDVATGDPVAVAGGADEVVMAVVPSPAESSLYAAVWRTSDNTRTIDRIDLTNGGRRQIFRSPAGNQVHRLLVTARQKQAIWEGVRVGGARLLVGDLETGEVVLQREFDGLGEALGQGLPLTADDNWIAVAGSGEVQVMRATDLDVANRWLWPEPAPISLALSRDSKRLVCGFLSGAMYVWSVPDGVELGVLRGHSSTVYHAAFSPDGTRLASAGKDGTVRIWNAETYEPLCTLTGHEAYVYSLAWSDDGETLVSGSGDSTVRVWSTQTAREREAARRERRRVLEQVEPEVLRLIGELSGAEAVDAAIEARTDWTPRERQVAHQVLLGEVMGTEPRQKTTDSQEGSQ